MEPDRFDTAPARAKETAFSRNHHRRKFILPLCASLCVHGLLLSIYIEPPAVPVVAKQRALYVELDVELDAESRPAQLLTEAPTATESAITPEPKSAAQASTLSPPSEPPPAATTKTPAPRLKQKVQQESLAVAPQDSYITSSSSAAAEYAERFLQAPCTPAEKASQIRNCARERVALEPNLVGEHTQWLKALFKADPFAGDNFDDDMKKIDALIAQSATLDELDDSGAPGSHFITSQRREIREEIARIDNKYRSVNLFAVLPKVIRATRNAREHFSTRP